MPTGVSQNETISRGSLIKLYGKMLSEGKIKKGGLNHKRMNKLLNERREELGKAKLYEQDNRIKDK